MVNQDDVPKVMEEYARIMKSGMDNLKKVKKNKSKSKATKGVWMKREQAESGRWSRKFSS